ncbi:SPOR domain-containing protein [Bacteroidota bacterium]
MAASLILMFFNGPLSASASEFQDTLQVRDTLPPIDTLLHLDQDTDSGPDSTMILLNDSAFNRMLDRAIDHQKKADSLQRLSVEWRKEAAKMDDPILRGGLQKKTVILEDSLKLYQELANEYFKDLEQEVQAPFLIRDTVLSGITVYRYNLTEEFMALLEEIRQPAANDSKFPAAEKPDKIPARQESGLRIFDSSPYGPDTPFERDFSIPPGVFYRIQLAVYSKEIGPDHFGGLSPITTESIPGRGMTRYFAGKFIQMKEAQKALVKVRALGYPDAFIIGYYDARKGSFSKLKELEK